MRCVIQRVKCASVTVDDQVVGSIQNGLMVLVGVHALDEMSDVDYCARKLAGLRVFEDADDKMNLSLADVNGAILLVSQFTLYADMRRGNRPSFIDAAPPDRANALYEALRDSLIARGMCVQTGVFKAHMQVDLINDGPVTLIIDTLKGNA